MKRLRELRERMDMYDLLSLGLILFLVGLALSYWNKFPVHMDSFYHMGVTTGYAKAGGIALHSFWEYAPAGRAQLYPPLLHVIMYGMTKTGLSTVSVARIVSFSAFPLMMISGWYGMRAMFTKKAAFYTTVVLSSCYLLFWHSAVETAASLVIILTPLIFVAVDRNKKIAASILLALALYSHLTLGHLVAFGLLIYAIHRREMFKEILWVLVGAYVLWLPWGIHILINFKSLSFSSPTGGTAQITVHVLVWLVALAGFVYCYFKKGKYYLLPAFLLGFIPIAFFYADRFWNVHVFLPLAMLGGVALAGLQDFVAARVPKRLHSGAARKAVLGALMAIPVALLLLLDPVYATASGGGNKGLAPAMAAGQAQSTGSQQSTGSAGTSANQFQPPQQSTSGGMPPMPPAGGQSGGTSGPGGQMATPGQPPSGMGPPGGGRQGGNGLSLHSTTTLSLLTSGGEQGQQSLKSSAIVDSSTLKLGEIIKANTSPGDIVVAPDPAVSNLVTGLTGRATTGGMFAEVSPSGGKSAKVATYKNASMIVVPSQFQIVSNSGQPAVAGIDVSNYKLVGTAGSYKVYKNTAATAAAGGHGTVIPGYVVFPLLG
ncbi:MAG: hypothetical protein ACYC99_18010, partial [Candidatus Geothermincolia bacterium]